jgi:hypothetical protein
MANTQVFTLGVTSNQSLGSAIDTLRQPLERLRGQVDGTRLGRLIGKVIRLGLELDKVRQVERQLTTEQAWAHEDQIDRLRREGDEVERLRRRYLSLGRKPVVLQLLGTISIKAVVSDSPAKAEQASKDQTSGSNQKQGQDDKQEADPRQVLNPWVLAGSIGGTAAGALAYGGYRKLPTHLRKSVNEAAEEGGPTAIGKALVALTEEKPEDKAKGLGAAAGELVGGVLGTLLGAVTKNERAKKYGGKIGEQLGEALGGDVGTWLYENVYAEPSDKDKPADSSKSVARSTSAAKSQGRTLKRTSTDGEEIEEEEEEEEVGEEDDEALLDAQDNTSLGVQGSAGQMSSIGSAALGATSLISSMGKAAAGSAGGSLTRRLLRRIPGAAVLDTGLQLAETYNSDATPNQKLEGYGSAVGGLGGGLAGAAAGAAIGSVVPVIGTVIGGLIGGALGSMGGESIGGLLGKALGSSKDDVPAASMAPVTQNPALQSPVAPAPINQQFTFTANMPVTFTNSLSDPSVLQQLEGIARRQLEELMRQARSVQLADTPHIAL